jgi:hypothetical protein
MTRVGTILWAKSNAAHYDHIHVEPSTRSAGVPPLKNPGMTDGVRFIYEALEKEFGPGAYFVNPPAGTKWTHMGGWNRRYIGGTTIWSQHAWWNALDIGPYFGVEQQQDFYDFLVALRDGTLEEEEAMTSPTFKNAKDIGAQAGVDPALKAAWDRAVAAGVATIHTDPDDISTAEQTIAYLDRYHNNVVAKLEARIAKLESSHGNTPHTHTATVSSVVAVS